MPLPATRIALEREIMARLPIARQGFESARFTCPGLCGCTCREEALAVACCRTDREAHRWIDDLYVWMQGLS